MRVARVCTRRGVGRAADGVDGRALDQEDLVGQLGGRGEDAGVVRGDEVLSELLELFAVHLEERVCNGGVKVVYFNWSFNLSQSVA